MKMTYNSRQRIGVIAGFGGVFITLDAQADLKAGTRLGFLLAISWVIRTLLIKKWGAPIYLGLTANQMLFGGLVRFIASFLLEDLSFQISALSITILLWHALIGLYCTICSLFYLVQTGDASKTSVYLFVPIGWLLDEVIDWNVILGGICILTGIFKVLGARGKLMVDIQKTGCWITLSISLGLIP